MTPVDDISLISMMNKMTPKVSNKFENQDDDTHKLHNFQYQHSGDVVHQHHHPSVKGEGESTLSVGRDMRDSRPSRSINEVLKPSSIQNSGRITRVPRRRSKAQIAKICNKSQLSVLEFWPNIERESKERK